MSFDRYYSFKMKAIQKAIHTNPQWFTSDLFSPVIPSGRPRGRKGTRAPARVRQKGCQGPRPHAEKGCQGPRLGQAERVPGPPPACGERVPGPPPGSGRKGARASARMRRKGARAPAWVRQKGCQGLRPHAEKGCQGPRLGQAERVPGPPPGWGRKGAALHMSGTRGWSAGRLPGGYTVRYAQCTGCNGLVLKPLIGSCFDFSQSTD